MRFRNLRKYILILVLILVAFLVITPTIHAGGLFDETLDDRFDYLRYPTFNYMIDFYAPSRNNWLPWNWGRAITGGVIWLNYALTAIFWYLQVLFA